MNAELCGEQVCLEEVLSLTHTSGPVQGEARLTGTQETTLGVQAFSVLTHPMHGALVDVLRVRDKERVGDRENVRSGFFSPHISEANGQRFTLIPGIPNAYQTKCGETCERQYVHATLTVGAVESLIALRAGGTIVFYDGLQLHPRI